MKAKVIAVVLVIFYIINSDYSVRAGGSLGLNHSGPDFGFSFGLSRWFQIHNATGGNTCSIDLRILVFQFLLQV